MTKTRTTTATSIIPLLLLATACGTPTANPESAAPQTKTQTQTKTEKKPAPEPKKETPAEEKPEEQTPTAPEPATDPTSGEWTETMNSPSDLSGQLDEAWLRCSPLNILTYDRIATQMESYLVTMGYRLQKDALTKYATRFENPAHDKVDILVTDYQYSAGCP